jgi:soluble lytic murein transglycosylase-like protein
MAGANGTGGVQQATAQQIAPGYQSQTPQLASGTQTTSAQQSTTGAQFQAPVAAGTGGTGGVPASSVQQPVTGAQFQTPALAGGNGTGGVQLAQATTSNPSQWPAPPRGVPSWGPTGPPPSGGAAGSPQQVREWIESARQVLIGQGVDPSLMNADQIAGLIQHESSGDPNAINLWDSNATAGHPSKGLMQTIDSTFSEHHLPGYDSIYAPVDNIIAGTRYAIDRYGSISNVPGVRAVQNGNDYVGY